ncbi:M10 family metallopeptidase C-terminal domain-containing protein [Sphingomonas sp.]|uniref:M10 family metallopeptidase C-terminal domain-containing protein n=1 Tax=Sphingomonas sp. TaxID=28214 RepID=UPI00286D96DA|nr:M10 family metallopeptidase C-terminal domain-containing protein [Sphingomonas sp.]
MPNQDAFASQHAYEPEVLTAPNTRAVDAPDATDISLDPYAGGGTYNGLDIYSPEEAADNLNRAGVNWTFGNFGALHDGVLTYGFWTEEQIRDSYYREPGAVTILADSFYINRGDFAEFTAEQQAMAIQNIQLWDDLIAVTFQQAPAPEADITFGFVQMSPAAGAHAYYPQEEAFNAYYGTDELGQTGGDVWANLLYQDSFSGANTEIGAYGWFAITHELGHSLGLAHGGDYNASDDNDGDGQPDPITYENDAYFAQDTQQYTIMSYFDGAYTGQVAVRWTATTGSFMYAQTPAVHDILAVQNVYGADYTTRAGDTVYGFNSTADRAVFDFSTNTAPIVTIWDGGGNDTLDLSGFNADNVIDLHEGAFSSAGYEINADYYAARAARLGWDQDDFNAWYAALGLGPDGRPVDNIAIAYGAVIENAIGGSGNDVIIGNQANNRLTGGAGADIFVFEDDGSRDTITDFRSRVDRIDLSDLDVTRRDVRFDARTDTLWIDTDGVGGYDMSIIVQGQDVSITRDIIF